MTLVNFTIGSAHCDCEINLGKIRQYGFEAKVEQTDN